MQKLFIGSVLIAGTIMLASAQEGGQPRPMPVNAPVPGVKAVRAVLASSTIPQMMGDELRGLLTGDKAIDEKIKALVKERDEKIKAVHEEFQTQLKALIGERKLIRASTTEKIKEMREEVRNTMMNASGTPMRQQVASGTQPMMQKDLRRPLPPVNPIKRFFQSFFGSNPQELQAEEIR